MRQRAGLAGGMLGLFLGTFEAAADGEKTPLIGGALLWEPSTHKPSGAIGLELEAAWWFGPFGVAVEGSGRTWVEGGPRALAVGGSVRLRVLEMLVPSILDASDVELGIELQGIVERMWSESSVADLEPIRHGLGCALRLRGSDEEASKLILESRFFVRVLSARPSTFDEVAMRTTVPSDRPREWTVVFGVGAAFGVGDPDYLDRFRRQPFGWMP